MGDVRGYQTNKQHGKVKWVEQNEHGFVPTKDHQNAVDPIRDLSHGRDRTALRFDVVCVCVLSEAAGKVDGFGLCENNESGG